jgi:hypothetical protein
MRIIIYNYKDAVSCTIKELGLKHIPYIGYDVIDEKLFLLSVIKYGISFREVKDNNV